MMPMPQAAPIADSEIALVQASFAKVVPVAEALSRDFYDILFRDNPGTRQLFPEDMRAQREKLISTLAMVIRGLRDFDAIRSDVAALGKRHVGYGAVAPHYEAVGAALIEALAQHLGEAWTPETADAWMRIYFVLAGTMLEAAEG